MPRYDQAQADPVEPRDQDPGSDDLKVDAHRRELVDELVNDGFTYKQAQKAVDKMFEQRARNDARSQADHLLDPDLPEADSKPKKPAFQSDAVRHRDPEYSKVEGDTRLAYTDKGRSGDEEIADAMSDLRMPDPVGEYPRRREAAINKFLGPSALDARAAADQKGADLTKAADDATAGNTERLMREKRAQQGR